MIEGLSVDVVMINTQWLKISIDYSELRNYHITGFNKVIIYKTYKKKNK
jgi:hypothetical protein